MQSLAGRWRVAGAVLAGLLAVLSVVAIPSGAGAQEAEGEAGGAVEFTTRIRAQRLADGRTEFGLQWHWERIGWGRTGLPGERFVPAQAAVGRWLASSPLTAAVAATPDARAAEVTVRIVARRLADGRIEFGLQRRGPDGEWGERLLPRRRFFPVDATVGRWLSSSPVTLPETTEPDEPTESTEPDEPTGTAGRDGPPGGAADQDGAGSAPEDADAGPPVPDGLMRRTITPLVASHGRTCAVHPEGGVSCWGRELVLDRVTTASVDDAVSVSFVGRWRTCVLHRDGTVSCWARGDETPLRRLVVDAVTIAAGSLHACAAHTDGGVSCWGSGTSGQLGDGSLESRGSLERVPGLEGVATLAAGHSSTCAVHVDGTLSCWGGGPGSSANYRIPTKVDGVRDVVAVAIGGRNVCVVVADGRLYCWPFAYVAQPILVEGVSDVVDVSVGADGVCALHGDGGVSCWGQSNSVGQLGNGTTTPQTTPTRLADISDAVAITLSDSRSSYPGLNAGTHACAMHEHGAVSCWGSNEFGQLGDNTYETSPAPVRARPVDGIESDLTLMLRAWGDLIVSEAGEEHPWLRVTWDYIRNRTFVVSNNEYAGAAFPSCGFDDGTFLCRTFALYVEDVSLAIRVIVHELAHIYDLTTSLNPNRAWGAVQLYFATTYPDCYTVSGGLRPGVEILADTMTHLVLPNAWLAYYHPDYWAPSFRSPFDSEGCPDLPNEPSLEAEEILRAGLAGEVPEWYTENFTDGFELWEALRSAPNAALMANLADEFGGFCTTTWLTYPLIQSIFPAPGTNPFC